MTLGWGLFFLGLFLGLGATVSCHIVVDTIDTMLLFQRKIVIRVEHVSFQEVDDEN